MFVDIENFKGAIGVENILMPYTKGRVTPDKKSRLPKEHITPDVCWQILKFTNNPVNIQHMLECIKELPASEQAQFKEVVLATFSNREQPNKQPHNVVLLGKKLAAASGYEAELAEAMKTKDGYFLFSSPKLDKAWVCLGNSFSDVDFSVYDKVVFLSQEKIEFHENVKFPKILELPNSPHIFFASQNHFLSDEGCDLSGVQAIHFRDGARVIMSAVKNLPPNLDVSMCSYVDLYSCDLKDQPNFRFREGAKIAMQKVENLPSQLDFSHCSDACLQECNLSGLDNLCFNEDAHVFLELINLPEKVDLSRVDVKELSICDFKFVKNIRFKEGTKVVLYASENLPPQLDFSPCAEVVLRDCDLSSSQLLFRDGARGVLINIEKLSPQLDVSMCSEVEMCECNASSLSHLYFRDDAKVILTDVRNLPTNLDFSQCSVVHLRDCDLSAQECIRFKNGANVCLENVVLPEYVDLSMIDAINLKGCDFEYVKNIRFKEGAKVNLCGAQKLPPQLDFSQFSELSLQSCYLGDWDNLAFKEGANVVLKYAFLPSQLDVSMCSQVDLENCILKYVKCLMFKNHKQMEDSEVKIPDDWNGKLVFVDELSQNDLNLTMKNKTNGGR